MPNDWMDVSTLSFNTLLLLERVQLSWFPGWVPEEELAIALAGNPSVAWFLRHKCPDIGEWIDGVMSNERLPHDSHRIRQAEVAVLRAIDDVVVYAVDPAVYDALPVLGWDSDELTSLVDFTGKTVLDIGAGTDFWSPGDFTGLASRCQG